ncbi:gephyrin-like molybdotransferase Glp [Microvirga massiliensis]|uniref:molybdopterin molybdotransferase MoeA n=1 Tax=Microvirga massiliensis TaxID=1033741 RepID=UPI00062B41E9|nr:gephyrin-like molybdotransferase Glp [Microvirga massiliensis]
MTLLPVSAAREQVLSSVARVVEDEEIRIEECAGRTLSRDLHALRDQPPFPASSMDGFALGSAGEQPNCYRVIGTSVAGRRFDGTLGPGEAVRIFTGAPVPPGTERIALQENTERSGESILVCDDGGPGRYIRRTGLDFRHGQALLHAGQRLDARRVGLAAAMGHRSLPVRRQPRIAILATGDELVLPGEPTGLDQIVASNPYSVAAIVSRAGGIPVDLGIARDRLEALEERIDMAAAADVDILVTLGGASVGEHDLVQEALQRRGMELRFWRVALRPGKPLLHGRVGRILLLGLPGNPVSSVVCAILFLVPAIRALVGDPLAGCDPTEPARLGVSLPANDHREDYLRATLHRGDDLIATPLAPQDSSMLSILAASDALLMRPARAPPASVGSPCRIISFDRYC